MNDRGFVASFVWFCLILSCLASNDEHLCERISSFSFHNQRKLIHLFQQQKILINLLNRTHTLISCRKRQTMWAKKTHFNRRITIPMNIQTVALFVHHLIVIGRVEIMLSLVHFLAIIDNADVIRLGINRVIILRFFFSIIFSSSYSSFISTYLPKHFIGYWRKIKIQSHLFLEQNSVRRSKSFDASARSTYFSFIYFAVVVWAILHERMYLCVK